MRILFPPLSPPFSLFQAILSGAISSQYLTAVLMCSPLALNPVQIRLKDKLVSVPYVDMTIKLMERFGVKVEKGGPTGWEEFRVQGKQTYRYIKFSKDF